MSFKHPEILYALLLLLIPIIVHLVRWKRFKQVQFTNVAFLQELEVKSRKSRILKELLVLLLRLLALASIIIAFAQPYFASEAGLQKIKQSKLVIYADNSLSMSALNGNTNLWQNLTQNLNRFLDDEQTYTFLTNDKQYDNISGKELKKLLFNINFSQKSTRHSDVLKKIRLLYKNEAETQQNLLYISDMQNVDNERLKDSLFDNNTHYYFYKIKVDKMPNISIDSLWLTDKDDQYYKLKIKLSASIKKLSTPVNIRRGNELLWQGSVQFNDTLQQVLEAQIGNNDVEAQVSVDDKAYRFDNQLFFTIHKPKKIKILLAGTSLPDYIKKVYTDDEFQLDFVESSKINYSNLNNYDLLILQDVKQYDYISSDALNKFREQYGNILIIPTDNQDVALQNFLQKLHINTRVQYDTAKVFLNKINYEHPLFKGVFLKKVKNFVYPFVKNHYKFEPQGSWLYKLSDNSNFASVYTNKGAVFVLHNSLKTASTNFTRAPSLIVPLLYQIGRAKNQNPTLYYTLGQPNSFSINESLAKDEVLKMKNGQTEFIPYQINRFNNVLVSTQELPQKSGIYDVVVKGNKISSVAYNYGRKENRQQFLDIPELENVSLVSNLDKLKKEQAGFFKEKGIWKYFVGLALLFLLLEMLVIKFWK